MRISDDYSIVNREDDLYLVNVNNGDVFSINDVTLDIVTLCERCDTVSSLCNIVYEKYSGEGDYSKEELLSFVQEMIQNGIIIE